MIKPLSFSQRVQFFPMLQPFRLILPDYFFEGNKWKFIYYLRTVRYLEISAVEISGNDRIHPPTRTYLNNVTLSIHSSFISFINPNFIIFFRSCSYTMSKRVWFRSTSWRCLKGHLEVCTSPSSYQILLISSFSTIAFLNWGVLFLWTMLLFFLNHNAKSF